MFEKVSTILFGDSGSLSSTLFRRIGWFWLILISLIASFFEYAFKDGNQLFEFNENFVLEPLSIFISYTLYLHILYGHIMEFRVKESKELERLEFIALKGRDQDWAIKQLIEKYRSYFTRIPFFIPCVVILLTADFISLANYHEPVISIPIRKLLEGITRFF